MKSCGIGDYKAGYSSEIIFLNYIGKSNKDMALELTKYF
tara:strand:+ start:44 stop:160 length:117 start_codon:yes stop_codon:yes gene_type:complete